ncbi:MAG: GIY-YIG nuclease family protein [Candidatus Contubernalis sp.]|nr:GIY-YIG nuclease family protein [Candidatus Contubernalis sp.]
MFYVYIVECSDGTLYTGWTTDLEKRLAEHNRGSGAKYTRGRYPVAVRYYETFETKIEAMQREYRIKRLSREGKIQLIAGHSS